MSAEDIRSRLHEDHLFFREWTTRMVEGKRASERAMAFAKLKPELTAHARAEERVAYDGLIRSGGDRESDESGREGYVEHHIADHLVARLSALNAATDEWRAHAKVLHEMLNHHIQEEETIFAQLGDAFSREQLEEMGTRFEQEKRAITRGRVGGQKPRRASLRFFASPRQRRLPVRSVRPLPQKDASRLANEGPRFKKQCVVECEVVECENETRRVDHNRRAASPLPTLEVRGRTALNQAQG